MSDQDQIPSHYERRLFPALFVIALGVLFLLRNLGVGFDFFQFHNWWAWLILVAAIAPLTRAVELYRASGKFDGNVVRHLLTAAMIATLAAVFLLDLYWQVWWPVFIIPAGVFMLLRPRDAGPHSGAG